MGTEYETREFPDANASICFVYVQNKSKCTTSGIPDVTCYKAWKMGTVIRCFASSVDIYLSVTVGHSNARGIHVPL